MTKNDIQHFLEKDTPNIFEVSYVSNVLGITTTLNESYSLDNKRIIIEEHLLMEGFWDDLKTMPGKIGNLLKVLKKIITEPNYVSKWVSGMKDLVITKGVKTVKEFLMNVVKAAEKNGLDKIKEGAQKLGQLIESSVSKLMSGGGWKAGIAMTGLALAIKYVMDKGGKLLLTGFAEMTKGWLTSEITTKLFTGVKKIMGHTITKLIGSFAGIGTFISWATTAFNGTQFILDTLGSSVERFNDSETSFYLHKNENTTLDKEILEGRLLKGVLSKNEFPSLPASYILI